MNTDLKQALAWVMGMLVVTLLSMVTYVGARIIQGQDKMNDTLTTILINQSDMNRRQTVMEAAIAANDQKWKYHEEEARHFYETYDLKKKQ